MKRGAFSEAAAAVARLLMAVALGAKAAEEKREATSLKVGAIIGAGEIDATCDNIQMFIKGWKSWKKKNIKKVK